MRNVLWALLVVIVVLGLIVELYSAQQCRQSKKPGASRRSNSLQARSDSN